MNKPSGRKPPSDRRGGLERRRGDRRRTEQPVLFEKREGAQRDPTRRRRVHRTIDLLPRSGLSSLASSILSTPILDTQVPTVISVREGLVASVYGAWEQATPGSDGARYRRFDGEHFRQVGSRLQPLDTFETIEHAEAAYEAEYQRAYQLIYAQYPDLRGYADEVDGEVVMR